MFRKRKTRKRTRMLPLKMAIRGSYRRLRRLVHKRLVELLATAEARSNAESMLQAFLESKKFYHKNQR